MEIKDYEEYKSNIESALKSIPSNLNPKTKGLYSKKTKILEKNKKILNWKPVIQEETIEKILKSEKFSDQLKNNLKNSAQI